MAVNPPKKPQTNRALNPLWLLYKIDVFNATGTGLEPLLHIYCKKKADSLRPCTTAGSLRFQLSHLSCPTSNRKGFQSVLQLCWIP